MSRFALIKAVLGPIMRLMFRPRVEGAEHIPGDGPVILAGNGGGTLNPGVHTKFNDVPLCNLYLSMMDRVGGKTMDRFGDSTGRLTSI